jgi:hypothetical protein
MAPAVSPQRDRLAFREHNRNARLARLREMVQMGHDVCDHDSKVLAHKTFHCRAWALDSRWIGPRAGRPLDPSDGAAGVSGRWALVAMDPSVDMTTPRGRMVANILVAVAQWESDMSASVPPTRSHRARQTVLGMAASE